MTHHVEINRIYSHYRSDKNLSTEDARLAFVNATLSSVSTTDEWREVFRRLALALNDIVPIFRCGKFRSEYWVDSKFPKKHEYSDLDGADPPLCDRETFRTILFGPVSELFFSFRYFFYCENTLKDAYELTIKDLEVMIADYIYHDNEKKRRIPPEHNFVFLSDRDKEIAIQNGDVTLDLINRYRLPVVRLDPNRAECKHFSNRFSAANEKQAEEFPHN